MSTLIARSVRAPLVWLAIVALAFLALMALEQSGSASKPSTSLSNIHLSGNPTAGKPNPPNGNCGTPGKGYEHSHGKSCHISKK
jgi:hypothetical protein